MFRKPLELSELRTTPVKCELLCVICQVERICPQSSYTRRTSHSTLTKPKKRRVAFYWLRETQKSQCAPCGAGIKPDREEYEQDYCTFL